MAVNWIDATSYTRGDTKREPRILSLEAAKTIHITVHKYAGCGEAWFVSAYIGNWRMIDCVDLHTEDVEQAKEKAVQKIREVFKTFKTDLENVLNVLNDA